MTIKIRCPRNHLFDTGLSETVQFVDHSVQCAVCNSDTRVWNTPVDAPVAAVVEEIVVPTPKPAARKVVAPVVVAAPAVVAPVATVAPVVANADSSAS